MGKFARPPISQDRDFHIDFKNPKSYQSPNAFVDDFVSGEQGTFVGSPTVVDGAIQLNGVDQYVEFGNNPLFNFNKENKFTISCWVKLNSYKLYGQFLSRRDVLSPDNGWYFSQHDTLGKLQFTMTAGGSATRTFINSVESIPLNTWCHISVVNEGIGYSGITFYLNGNALTIESNGLSKDTLPSGLPNTVSTLRLGAIDSAGSFLTDGEIQDTIIYPRALSAEEELQNYNATKSIQR